MGTFLTKAKDLMTSKGGGDHLFLSVGGKVGEAGFVFEWGMYDLDLVEARGCRS